MKKKIVLFLLILVVIAGAIFSYFHFFKKKSREEEYDKSKTLATPIPVKVAKVFRGDLPIYVSSSGKLEAIKINDYISEVSGNISLKVKEGDFVKKGTLLFSIDNADYKIAYENALIAYKKAYVEFLAVRDIITKSGLKIRKGKNIYSDDPEIREIQKNVIVELKNGNLKRERVKYRLASVELSLKRALENYKKCKIYAPFSGVVGKIEVSEGEYVRAGRKILTLADISKLRIKAKILVKDLDKIKVGKPALIFPIVNKKKYYGVVYSVNPLIYDDNSTYAVVEIDNHKSLLNPGVFCDVLIETKRIKNKILVPKKAVLKREGGKTLVFKVRERNGKKLAYWTFVDIGEENYENVIIKNNLKPGDLVIIEGHYTLSHKAPIEIMNGKNKKNDN